MENTDIRVEIHVLHNKVTRKSHFFIKALMV